MRISVCGERSWHCGYLKRYPELSVTLYSSDAGQMKATKIIEENFLVVIVREVLIALAYLHKQGVIHRDIKGEIILMLKIRHNSSKLTPSLTLGLF